MTPKLEPVHVKRIERSPLLALALPEGRRMPMLWEQWHLIAAMLAPLKRTGLLTDARIRARKKTNPGTKP